MNNKEFQDVLDLVLCKCTETLGVKAGEYATDDRLHNFKIAAKLQHCTPITALAGMMCKHTVSVYDLIQKHEQGEDISQAMWDEKIGDSINYLILLSALIKEEKMDRCVGTEVYYDTNAVLTDYIFPTRQNIETIIENATSTISAYGRISVNDFCELSGINTNIKDADKLFWTDFSNVEIERNGNGYSFKNLPRPKISYKEASNERF